MSMAALRWAREPRPNLGIVATAVLRDLADRANESGVCWPSINTIAAETGLSRRAVSYALRRLEDERLLSTKQIAGRSSRYALKIPAEPMHDVHDTHAPRAYPHAPRAPKASISQKEAFAHPRETDNRPNADAYRKADPDLPDVTVDEAVLELARQWLDQR